MYEKETVYATDDKPIVFKTNNIERMRINKNGNVGIGITNPGARLNVIVGSNVSLTTTGSFLLGPLELIALALMQAVCH